MINTFLAASLSSSFIFLFLTWLKKPIVHLMGAIWYYHCWFIALLPWLIAIPLNFFISTSQTLHIYSSRSSFSNALYHVTTNVSSVPDAWWVILWCAGLILVTSYYYLQHYFFRRELNHNLVNWSDEKLEKLQDILPAAISESCFRLSSSIESPLICSFPFTKIYLPEDFFERFSKEEQVHAISHELVHYKRKDILANGCMLFLTCINWFNPCFYYASYYFRLAQELSCDAVVNRAYSSCQKHSYGMALLKTASHRQNSAVSCGWSQALQLKERFSMLKQHSRLKRYTYFGSSIFTCLALVTLMISRADKVITSLVVPRLQFIADNQYILDSKRLLLVGNVEFRISNTIKFYSDRLIVHYAEGSKGSIYECIFDNHGMILLPTKAVYFKSGVLYPETLQFLGDKLQITHLKTKNQ